MGSEDDDEGRVGYLWVFLRFAFADEGGSTEITAFLIVVLCSASGFGLTGAKDEADGVEVDA